MGRLGKRPAVGATVAGVSRSCTEAIKRSAFGFAPAEGDPLGRILWENFRQPPVEQAKL